MVDQIKRITSFTIILLANSFCFPVITDWFRYSDLGNNCSGTFHYELNLSGQKNSDTHCYSGRETNTTESGFRVAADFADKGHLIVYGRGDTNQKGTIPIHLGLFKTAGDKGSWYCASSGEYRIEKEKHSYRLNNISPISITASKNSITTNSSNILEIRTGEDLIQSKQIWGYGCDPEYRRCTFLTGEETKYIRIYLHTETSMIEKEPAKVIEAVIMMEDARSPNQVKILTAAENNSTANFLSVNRNTKLILNLTGLSEAAACPSGESSQGTLTGYWER